MTRPLSVQDLINSMAPEDPQDRSSEAALFDRLSRQEKVASEEAVDTYETMSLEDLVSLAKDRFGGEHEKVAGEFEKTAEMEKLAFGAQIAAHSFWQELELIKLANEKGLCRFCKEEAVMDGFTIGVNCAGEQE
jgi:hypothetical protein